MRIRVLNLLIAAVWLILTVGVPALSFAQGEWEGGDEEYSFEDEIDDVQYDAFLETVDIYYQNYVAPHLFQIFGGIALIIVVVGVRKAIANAGSKSNDQDMYAIKGKGKAADKDEKWEKAPGMAPELSRPSPVSIGDRAVRRHLPVPAVGGGPPVSAASRAPGDQRIRAEPARRSGPRVGIADRAVPRSLLG